MAEERTAFAGIDISDDVTQISYFTAGMEEPQMTGIEYADEDYLIPTAIEKTDNGWLIGKACNNPVVKLFSKADYGIKKLIGDYDALEVLAIYAEQIVRFAILQAGVEKFDTVTFALSKTDRMVIEAIRKHFTKCGLSSIELVFITHAESCVYYVLNQKRELRINDVVFFDFSEERLIYRKLHMTNPVKKPMIDVMEIDCTARCSYTAKSDEAFKNLIAELFDKQQICTVYLIGEGFKDESWAKESINYICNRRRVFKGRNLHALGACYKSMDGFDKYSYESYCILCKGRTYRELCMEVVFKEERNEAILIGAGELWYDAGADVEGILNKTDKINVIVHTATGEILKSEELSLSELPYRQNRMTRIKINAIMLSENEVQLTISDLGFGEFVAGSGIQLTKNIQY